LKKRIVQIHQRVGFDNIGIGLKKWASHSICHKSVRKC